MIDVAPLVRRGRTQAATQGIYYAILRTVHAGAGDLTVFLTPYNIGDSGFAPFPNPVPPLYDIWLLSASMRQVSGTGTLAAELSIEYPGFMQAFGEDDSGNKITVATEHILAYWDSLMTVGLEWGILNEGGVWKRIGVRLPRSNELILRIWVTASALATFDCQLTLGVFPVGLGQDGLV